MRIPGMSLALILLLIAPAAAQTSSSNCPHPAIQRAAPTAAVLAARRTERQACAADITKFCANVLPGCGRPMQCLRSHASELSAPCTGAIAALHAARAQSR